VTSRWTDLSRPPLSAARLNRVLTGGAVWREIRVVPLSTSTNAEVCVAARAGAEEGLVIIAEEQTEGRGRLDRRWSSPPRASILLSGLLRPALDPASWPLIPLLAGLAVVEAVLAVGAVEASLKWPNDVLVDERKLAGLLVERVDGGVVVGVGLNVSTRVEELVTPNATSLAIAGGVTDREILAMELLRALERRYLVWIEGGGVAASVIPAYRERCETIGRQVTLQITGGELVQGVATAVDDGGRLVVRDDATGVERAWLAGDVIHLRKAN
jgi:BirA family biotin operon repressor/biotin-[acetyl-CoA-carboxylase] ligase